MDDEALQVLALAAAVHITPGNEVCRSPDGVYCLMCLQEHYGRLWTSMDNGTYYCERHRKVLRGIMT